MATRIHANNFSTTINGSITDSDLSVVLTSVTGFPVIGAGVTCNLTLQSGSVIEIITATARSSNTLTITRGSEGTTPVAWADLSSISIRPTADSVDRKEDLISARSITSATVATDDKVLIQDTSASNALKTVTAQSIIDLSTTTGSFTPTFDFATPGDLSIVYTTQTGTFTRVGNMVFIALYLVFTPTFTTSSGEPKIGGLPFTSASLGSLVIHIPLTIKNTAITFPAGVTQALGVLVSSATYINLRGTGSTVGSTVFSPSNFTTATLTQIGFSGIYKV